MTESCAELARDGLAVAADTRPMAAAVAPAAVATDALDKGSVENGRTQHVFFNTDAR